MIADTTFQNRQSIARLQEQNFATMLDLCFERHPYYRNRFKVMGLKRTDIRSLADIHLIPIVSKKEYAADPEAFSLETEGLVKEASVGWDVMHTTGTSGGKPTPFFSTAYDFYGTLTANRRALEIRKIAETDVIANLCPMTLYPYGAYHRTIAAANVVKVPVISPLPGRPSEFFHWSAGLDDVVAAIARTRATILWGVTSYVRRVLIRAEEISADFRSVRLAFVTGEAVSTEMRRDLTDRLHRIGDADAWVSISYAATEMQVGAVECMPDSGYHNPAPEQFYFEIVDPETHVQLPHGQRGLSVLTHLDRRGTVLLRYAMGDYAALSVEQCPHCGRWTDRFVGMPSRADELLKVKGMLINPEAVIDLLLANGQIDEFQIVIDRENKDDALSGDRFRLLVDTGPKTDLESLSESVRLAIGVRPEIEITPRAKIFDPEKSLKAKRLLDLRKSS
jgi:phenylacetate-coenzyme A ligase PaaK-like adenylate-forming protein